MTMGHINHHHVPVHMHGKLEAEPVPTEVLGIPASAAVPELQVLVVPGNPGNAGYYRTFMQILHRALGGRAHVVSCSHAGHNVHPSNTGAKLWHLEDQIQHKVNFIRQHLLLPGRPPLVILAHSVGSYMTVHALHRLETGLQQHGGKQHSQDPSCSTTQPAPPPHTTIDIHATTATPHPQQDILHPAFTSGLLGHAPSAHRHHAPLSQLLRHLPSPFHHEAQPGHPLTQPSPAPALPTVLKVVALMPFFQADLRNQWRQRILRLLSRNYHFMSAVAAALRMLPVTLRMACVRWWTLNTMDHAAVETTAHLLHPHSIKNNFYMAKTEFRDMSRPFQWHLLSRLGDRLHVLACPRDVWMSDRQYQHMKDQVPGVQATWHPDLEHAFCVSQRQCEEVTRHIVKILESARLHANTAPGGDALLPVASASQGAAGKGTGQALLSEELSDADSAVQTLDRVASDSTLDSSLSLHPTPSHDSMVSQDSADAEGDSSDQHGRSKNQILARL